MPLSDKIASSEAKFKGILEEYFLKIYDVSYLPSHGIDHHRRVWHYGKEILNHLDNQGLEFSQSFVDQLIISCFLHDSGMSVDQGFGHGAEGRKICENFLKENRFSSDVFSEALYVIENHDNKEYSFVNNPEDLITILSVADDLDAFGYIGIYRYLEIYIARKKPMMELGHLIADNCETRYQHLLRSYGFDSELVRKYTMRYETLSSFFSSYNQQVLHYIFNNQSISGYCGVAEIIGQKLENRNTGLTINYNYDPVIQHFLSELEIELSDFR